MAVFPLPPQTLYKTSFQTQKATPENGSFSKSLLHRHKGVQFPVQWALNQAQGGLVCFWPSESCIFVCITALLTTGRLLTTCHSCSLTHSLSKQGNTAAD